MQLYLGSHLSSARGFRQLGLDACSIGATTCQFFTRNPRGTRAKALDLDDVAALVQIMQEHGFGPLVAHAPYTLNPCSADPHLRDLAAEIYADDLARLEHLPGTLYVLHPGNHTGQGIETGIEQIAECLNRFLKPEQKTILLLETMSGKGSEVGSRLTEIQAIIERLDQPQQVGVCCDACHLFAAGYDIVNDLDGVLAEIERIIGLKRLKAFHLNDSQHPFNSHKDRHAAIGAGEIGLEAIVRIINHPQLRHLPFILETPHELTGHQQEIALLRKHWQVKASAEI